MSLDLDNNLIKNYNHKTCMPFLLVQDGLGLGLGWAVGVEYKYVVLPV